MATAKKWSASERSDGGDTATVIGDVGEPTGASNTGDAVRAYLVQIGRVPLLTAAEERALCQHLEEAQATPNLKACGVIHYDRCLRTEVNVRSTERTRAAW